ncbi:MAG: hypothetical protein AVDCRST_MAG45-1063 [uncultured Solirubrobacterales bacterium]|uniref:DUF5615 domain-containing protein n=1 Tax=uncultured Solirubrobacterales bacterium TaxID=768556 RepID=A0A6J4SEP2_9ACTN|nr:MAG: hypothetical protein AVDCRST_MAG45-1063 [uncultured Solirubrobacterales bacterium]
MNLLLDEMLSAVIAEQLRIRDHDAAAVDERADLRGLADIDLFERAQVEERAVVTYDRDDFLTLDRRYRDHGRDHHGIVIVNPRRFPQGAGTIGALVAALEALLATGPPYPSFVHWLH